MRPSLFLLFLALGCATPASADSVLRIGMENADQPISFVNAAGQPDGFTAGLLAAMGPAGLGEFRLVPNRWTALVEDFRAGRIDALANVARTDERLREMDFSISHAYVHGVVYSRRDHASLRSTADFAGKTIGTVNGTISLINAIAHGGWGATVRSFDSTQAAIDATQRGECDATLVTYGTERRITNNFDMRRELVDDIVHEFRFAVHKGDTATLARLNDALATVHQNGAFDRLYGQWIGPIEPHPIALADLRPYARGIIVGVLALAAIFWWQRHMLARVSRQAKALKESETRFHQLVDSAFEGWIIQQDGVIVMANATFAATFGFTNTELIGKPTIELGLPDAATNPASAAPHEVIGRRKDGSPLPIEIAGQPCTFNGRPARIAAVRDLTFQKQAAADQLVLSKLESTGILAGGIAHDFNNLLATMVLNLDLALLGPRHSDDTTRCIQAAKTSALSARTLTQQLITFAQGGSFLRQPTDLAALLQKTVPLALSGSNVRAEISLAPDLWPADIDAGQIERVISNLVLNAREAMPAGGVVTLHAANLTLRAGDTPALAPGEYVRVDITDRGYGIPAEVLPKIFDPYFSTKQRGTQKGMGLGLTISHSILLQHNGALTVDSRVGAGTTFHLYLPATRQPADPVVATAATTGPRSGRILVMDDEAQLRDIVRRSLEHEGYTVETAADGKIAIELFAQAQAMGRPFDAVLLDLTVRGGVGGLEAMPALLAFNPSLKAVVMSGYAHETILVDYARHGFSAAIAKPFEVDTLRAVIARVLGA